MSQADTTDVSTDPGSASVQSEPKKSHFYEREVVDQNTNPSSWFKLTTDIKEQLAELKKRSERFANYGWASFYSAFLMLGVSGGLHLLANWFEPNAIISFIDVPDAIKELYSDSAYTKAADTFNNFNNMVSAGEVGRMLKYMTMVASVVMLVFGIHKMFSAAKEDTPPNLMFLILPVFLFAGANMVGGVLFNDESSSESSPREIFLSDVKNTGSSIKVMEDSLRKHGASDSAIAYIVAQMVIAKHKDIDTNPICCEEKTTLIEKANILKSEVSTKLPFAAQPSVSYAIDKVAFGKASAPLSEAYEVSAVRKSQISRGVSAAILFTGVGTLLVGIFTGLFGRYLRRRLTRIRSLYPIEKDSKHGVPND